MINTDQINTLLNNGGSVVDAQGERIGSLGQVYLDDQTGEPTWATVNTGLFGMSESFVPLRDASVSGDDIRVAYTKDQVKDAPKVEQDGHLEPEDERRLYEHYSFDYDHTETVVDRDVDVDRAVEVDRDVDVDRAVDVDHAGDDASMILSEERLNVGTERREAGKVRLRKYVVTENVTQTVPVTREEVRLERVPLDETSVHGGELGDDVAEVTLHEERPVVEKDTVAVEEVRLGKEAVTENVTVSEQVAHEEVTTDDVTVDDRDLRRDDRV